MEYGFLVYASTSESQLRPYLILQKKILRILFNLPCHASCTHLFTESGIPSVYAMYVGALLKYLSCPRRKMRVEKCVSSSHNMKTRMQLKALLHYAQTSDLTEKSIQYRAVNFIKCFMKSVYGLFDQEQNRMLHRFYRDILNLYVNDNNDVSFFQKKCSFFYSTFDSSLVSTSNSPGSNAF